MFELLGLTEPDAIAVLAVMRAVATGNGRLDFAGSTAAIVRATAHHVLHVDVDVDALPDELGASTLEILRNDPRLGLASVQCGLLVPLIADDDEPERLETLAGIAADIGVDEPAVTATRELLATRAASAVTDLRRRTLSFKSGGDDGDAVWTEFQRALTEDTAPPEGLAAFARVLAGEYDDGTLGAELHHYYETTGFEPPGRAGTMPYLICWHDSHHVLAGYPTSAPGEMYVTAFTAAMGNRDGLDYLALVVLEFHHHIQLANLDAATRPIDVELFAHALERGAATTLDLTSPRDWDLVSALSENVSVMRARANILGTGTVGPGGSFASL